MNWSVSGQTVHLRHPLKGVLPGLLRPARAGYLISAPEGTPGFPQIDVSSAGGAVVWPLWALVPCDGSQPLSKVDVFAFGQDGLDTALTCDLGQGDGLCWVARGTRHSRMTRRGLDVWLDLTPGQRQLRDVFQNAVSALESWYGPLPWDRLHMLIEHQATDTGRQRGFAHRASDGSIWCRALIRPRRSANIDRADAIELIVHELLHLLIEFDTPPGHLLTEGLVTYLARRILVRQGRASKAWMAAQRMQAARDIRRSGWRRHSLDWVTQRFFDSEEARRLAYRKGHNVMQEIDDILRGRLPVMARDLARQGAARGGQLKESDFMSRLPARARAAYRRALTGVGENAPGNTTASKMRRRPR